MTTDPFTSFSPDLEHHHESDEGVTLDDRTPYAIAREEGSGGFFKMCKWVWTAGGNRLKHLGLSRPSAHSRRFARINILLFSIASSLCILANAGWHSVQSGPGMEGQSTTPAGKGWKQVVLSAQASFDPSTSADTVIVSSMWFNGTWALFAASICFVCTLILGMLLVGVVSAMAGRSLQPEHRTDSRLRCGIHYGTAWLQFVILAMLLFCLRPVASVGRITDWPMTPSPIVIDAAALVLATLGLMLGWFWLIRLGGGVPKSSRQSVNRFFVFWGPIGMTLVLGWYLYGLYRLAGCVPQSMNLHW